MANWLSGAMAGAGTGAKIAAGTALGGGWGGVIGGVAGLGLGALSDWQHSKNVAAAKRDINNWQNEANRILEESFNGRTQLSGPDSVRRYKELRDNYDPNGYVLTDEQLNSFDKTKYNVEDFLNPNAQAIRDDVARTIQHTAAGSAMGHSSGAAASIMQGVMEKDEQLWKDARDQMNQERQFDYGMYSDFIKNKQQQLQTLQQGARDRMEMLRGDIQFDQQAVDNYNNNRINLGNAVMLTKAQLV